ncbi:S26 family signal peptidase [archaeon]|nr:MAG: S26 family signal peptidase [archaeon]
MIYRQHKATAPMPVTLEKDMYWLAGDNPTNSLDSRSYGPVPQRRILGRVTHRLSLSYPFFVRIENEVPQSTLQIEKALLEYRSFEDLVHIDQHAHINREQQRGIEEEAAKRSQPAVASQKAAEDA